ncbi:ATP-binding protein [Clostridium paraputrificum]|uniref:ATP-binding protein n=1 Tax=Clostridium paraputrificum TaxID=29363 RepID=UPI001FA8F315|nr:ATP-binding protein [Clostridium paraputrificum]
MKKMTGIRLINWHAFQNETIRIHNSVLISGENGAGKSTILDAIQYVLTCSKNNFNKAANESAKRELEGYVRYKTGKEEKTFERNGNVTAHVALEFYEERKKEYFIIGTVIDSASDTSSKSFFYRIEGKRLNDIEFIKNNNIPRDISDFKVYGKYLKIQNLNSPSQAREDFRNRLGNYNNKFFELLPKALAFKPIGNVKEFVYSYILDEKEVNIENLRQNIRTYRDFEELLEEVKIKITKLEEIKNIYDNYQNYKKMKNYKVT